MHLKFIGFSLATILLGGCYPNSPVDPLTTGPEPVPYRIVRDSVQTGSYLGIAIDEQAPGVYPKIQALQATKGVTALAVVSNIYADLLILKARLPLYQYILLDQKSGTDSGVQITMEGQTIKRIYLNSGRQLTQWPENQGVSSSVRVGNAVSTLYDKLVAIRTIDRYANKFESISLLTKDLSTDYDGGMSQSPQWYFGYSTGPDQMDQIQVHFKGGRVSKIYIDHYAKY